MAATKGNPAMVNTTELAKQVSATGRRGGGREGRRAIRAAPMASLPALVREIPVYQMVPDEAIELIHEESLRILEEVGCEFRDDEAIAMWKKAGARVEATRVRIDRGLLMDLVAKVPAEFTLNARNPERTVKVGGRNTIFVPMYGAPYVRDLDNQRRYGSLADLNNFHRLAFMQPALHSSSSIVCEPMEIPVPRRHLHIIHSALTYSDKPFMGIVTSKERAEDVMKMAGIVFGENYVKDNTVLVSITNCNSPLVWDATMLDAMKVYARHNQPLILAPFALCGASTSASAVGAVAQVNAEALAGVAFTQLVRPGSPQIYGQFMVTVDMKSGAPMGGTPEAAQMMFLMGALARKYRLPWRT
jgi:trimethylamine--corrinoid protein Co-methyltransferase